MSDICAAFAQAKRGRLSKDKFKEYMGHLGRKVFFLFVFFFVSDLMGSFWWLYHVFDVSTSKS